MEYAWNRPGSDARADVATFLPVENDFAQPYRLGLDCQRNHKISKAVR